MAGRLSTLQNREQLPANKNALLKTGLRKTSSVTFGENSTMVIDKQEEYIDLEEKENDDIPGQIKEDRPCEDEGNSLQFTLTKTV